MEKSTVLLDTGENTEKKSSKTKNRMKILLQQPTVESDTYVENIEDDQEINSAEGEKKSRYCYIGIV